MYNAQELKKALLQLQTVVPTKTTHEILKCVLISDGKLTVTNLDQFMSINLPGPTETCIPFGPLLDILRNTTSDTIDISNNGDIVCGNIKTHIEPFDVQDYPNMPVLKDLNKFELTADTLKGLISQTCFATASWEIGSVLAGIGFNVSNGRLGVCGTDGSRLSHVCVDDITCGITDWIVPSDEFKKLDKLCNGENITVGVNKDWIEFSNSYFRSLILLKRGEYPNYAELFPSDHTYWIEYDRKDILVALKQLEPCLKGLKAIDALVKITSDTITAKDTEILVRSSGGGSSPICDLKPIWLNHGYLSQGIKACNADRVMLEINGCHKPVVIRESNFRYLVMPVSKK